MTDKEPDHSIHFQRRAGLPWLACVLAAAAIAPAQAQTAYKETLLHTFASSPKGANPYAGLLRDSAGNLYGTVETGGTAGWGAVFKVDAAGNQTLLYNFTGGSDGGNPYAGVIADSSGNLYGTASTGGSTGAGVVYKLDTARHETVLYSFTGSGGGGTIDGLCPVAGVIRDSAGNFYGTALRRHSQSGHRIQAGYGRTRDRAVYLHGRGRWGRPRSGRDPGLGRQSVRDYSEWWLCGRGAGL
jgi:uncharacterized repeat protein (TIGR03803 family)